MTWKGWENYLPAAGLYAPARPPQKRRKYGNVPTEVDGHTFASQREADRYRELLLLQQVGKIHSLTIQPRLPLLAHTPSGASSEVGCYVADFRYCSVDAVNAIYEDAKGVRTALYKWKKKHAELQYGITIVEV